MLSRDKNNKIKWNDEIPQVARDFLINIIYIILNHSPLHFHGGGRGPLPFSLADLEVDELAHIDLILFNFMRFLIPRVAHHLLVDPPLHFWNI